MPRNFSKSASSSKRPARDDRGAEAPDARFEVMPARPSALGLSFFPARQDADDDQDRQRTDGHDAKSDETSGTARPTNLTNLLNGTRGGLRGRSFGLLSLGTCLSRQRIRRRGRTAGWSDRGRSERGRGLRWRNGGADWRSRLNGRCCDRGRRWWDRGRRWWECWRDKPFVTQRTCGRLPEQVCGNGNGRRAVRAADRKEFNHGLPASAVWWERVRGSSSLEG